MRVLELGGYLVPAYAGMILAEQGHEVTKWVSPDRADPIQGLRDGDALWAWVNHGKHVQARHARGVAEIPSGPAAPEGIVDNVRAATWQAWGVDPAEVAGRLGVPWVSMRDDFDQRSFDAVAQARAWGDHLGWVPAYLGDTCGGLWLAFKLLNAAPGHHVLRQGAVLAKLVEGELVVTPARDGQQTPWDPPGTYGANGQGVRVRYRGEEITEPFRDAAWRLARLQHTAGRLTV